MSGDRRSPAVGVPRDVRVGFGRLPGWLDRYEQRHPGTAWSWGDTSVDGSSPDGSSARVTVPWGRVGRRDAPRADLVAHVRHPWRVGVLVVRRGGFAVALAEGAVLVDRKLGRRHVQGRSKAGGWSQQRFARRRDNQARQAFAAAADHAARILSADSAARPDVLVVAGDRAAVGQVLTDPRLAGVAEVPRLGVDGVGDPHADTLQRVLLEALSVRITLVDPPEPTPGG